jgi:hypothetical protein
MTKYKWLKLREVENLINAKLLEGDLFLYGKSMIGQKDIKEMGQQITYFKVIKSKGKNIEYIQVFDILEEDTKNAKND